MRSHIRTALFFLLEVEKEYTVQSFCLNKEVAVSPPKRKAQGRLTGEVDICSRRQLKSHRSPAARSIGVNTATAAAAPARQHLCLEAEAVSRSGKEGAPPTCSEHLQAELQSLGVGEKPLPPTPPGRDLGKEPGKVTWLHPCAHPAASKLLTHLSQGVLGSS